MVLGKILHILLIGPGAFRGDRPRGTNGNHDDRSNSNDHDHGKDRIMSFRFTEKKRCRQRGQKEADGPRNSEDHHLISTKQDKQKQCTGAGNSK